MQLYPYFLAFVVNMFIIVFCESLLYEKIIRMGVGTTLFLSKDAQVVKLINIVFPQKVLYDRLLLFTIIKTLWSEEPLFGTSKICFTCVCIKQYVLSCVVFGNILAVLTNFCQQMCLVFEPPVYSTVTHGAIFRVINSNTCHQFY